MDFRDYCFMTLLMSWFMWLVGHDIINAHWILLKAIAILFWFSLISFIILTVWEFIPKKVELR